MSTTFSDTRTDANPIAKDEVRPSIPRVIRKFAILIILGWIAIIGLLNILVPQLDEVGKMRSVSMAPDDAQSVVATKRMGAVFNEYKSNSSAMIVLEGQNPLGNDAHAYYDQIVKKLDADTKHVEHVQDMWSDPLTGAGAQSNDGKAAYVQVYLAGNQGEALANESVEAVQDIVKSVPAPEGVKAYVTGPAALSADQHIAGDRSLQVITTVTFAVIIAMLLLVYRSIITVLLTLVMVVFELSAARGMVAFLGYYNVIGLSTFATNLLVTLAIAAATDYAIFLMGRYQEARATGESREDAYYTMYKGTAHVVLGSGLTIAGATFCLHFTNLPYFQTLGIPLAIGMVVVVAAALTLGPAAISVATRFGKTLEPKRTQRIRGWRKVGALVVRWPGPILIMTIGVALVGLLTLPGYRTNYNDRNYLPADLPANAGYAAADRHFSQARMNPEVLMIESDHDLRNSADFLVIDKIAKAVFRVPGIGRVQAITRPEGTPIEHTSIPFQISMQGVTQQMNQKYQEDQMADMLKQADMMQTTIDSMLKMQSLTQQMADTTHGMVEKMKSMTVDIEDLRNHISDFDDFFRPIRSYFYWDKHCFDIPSCWALRSVFDTLDGIDELADQLQVMTGSLDHLDQLMPQMLATLPPTIESMKTMRDFMVATHSTMAGIQAHQQELAQGSTLMGNYFDEAKNDDSFYLPPEVFKNPDFERGLKMFVSPDGKAVRLIITHQGDPASVAGIEHVAGIKEAVADAVKGTPLGNAKVSLAGTASLYSDMQNGVTVDLLIACIASMILIFAIMLLITRSVVAALAIVSTVAASLGTACGLSVLLWQDILGLGLQWIVIPLSIVILLAVGSDYNLLVVSRLKEEIHAGLNTGIIRGMGATGRVVTAAGLVFAFTMMSMIVSDLRVVGQLGMTIGIGLLVDTLIVRSFMTPSIAAALGRWFWWPLNTFKIVKRRGPEPASDANTVPISQPAMV
jgi:RND superfamily putative drug exporter